MVTTDAGEDVRRIVDGSRRISPCGLDTSNIPRVNDATGGVAGPRLNWIVRHATRLMSCAVPAVGDDRVDDVMSEERAHRRLAW